MSRRNSEILPKKRDELELEVESLAFGGKGVARISGYVVFVEGAVPGDRVRAVVTRSRPSYADARVIEVLNLSRSRIDPRCSHFGICGGCSWQTLDYQEQLGHKNQQVIDCLEHIGGLSGFEVDAPLAANPLWRYRNKVEFAFAGSDDIQLGFHLPGQWQQIINIDDCCLHSELTNHIRNQVRDFAQSTGMPAFNQKAGSGFWRHLVLREGVNTGEVMVNIVTAPGDFPRREDFVKKLLGAFPGITSIIWSINDTRAAVAGGLPFQVLAGRDHFFEEISGLKLKISPSSFLQTNTLMAEQLYQRALEYADLNGSELVLDLYSGIGSIALLSASACRSVIGAEIMGEAVRLAAENAGLNKITNTRFIAGKVRATLKDIVLAQLPQVIILDPPRAGASKKEIQRIIELQAPAIVYVSCNAATMAGNARQLAEGGYQLVKCGAVDMFPHTPHIESVSLFHQCR